MSVTITAVANPAAQAPDVAAEHALQEFAVNLQNSAAAGMPQLANPAALASELAGFLRGYVERAKNVERAMRSVRAVDDDGANLVLTAALDPLRQDLHGGPARERLEPEGAGPDSSALLARVGSGELDRFQMLALMQMESALEGSLLTNGVSQAIRSFDSLLRGA